MGHSHAWVEVDRAVEYAMESVAPQGVRLLCNSKCAVAVEAQSWARGGKPHGRERNNAEWG